MKKKSANPNVHVLLEYTMPALYTGEDWFVAFNAFDPLSGKMKRKRYRLNSIKKISDRRKRANDLIKTLTEKLAEGWNPFIDADSSSQYSLWVEVCEKYSNYVLKLFNDGNLREKTMHGYLSMKNKLCAWNENRTKPIRYAYQFNKEFLTKFLDYLYIDEECSIRTRNNYLTWLRIFESYLLQHSYICNKITDEIPPIRNNKADKNRKVINEIDMRRLVSFLEQENKYYLLACYCIYYMMIRPKEMSFLRIRDFNLKNQTVFIPGTISKNKKDAFVTLPAKVAKLMIELGIFNHSGDEFLFSKGFKPGTEYASEKSFRDYWERTVRKRLNFNLEYKFYSLKDTGITNMLRHVDTLTVRDQARHSSLLMTDIYTPHLNTEGSEKLKNYEPTI